MHVLSLALCIFPLNFLLFIFQCQESMMRAVATDEGLGVEYDEHVVCDVCRDVSQTGLPVPTTAMC